MVAFELFYILTVIFNKHLEKNGTLDYRKYWKSTTVLELGPKKLVGGLLHIYCTNVCPHIKNLSLILPFLHANANLLSTLYEFLTVFLPNPYYEGRAELFNMVGTQRDFMEFKLPNSTNRTSTNE